MKKIKSSKASSKQKKGSHADVATKSRKDKPAEVDALDVISNMSKQQFENEIGKMFYEKGFQFGEVNVKDQAIDSDYNATVRMEVSLTFIDGLDSNTVPTLYKY